MTELLEMYRANGQKSQAQYCLKSSFIAKILATLEVLHLALVILLDKNTTFVSDKCNYVATFRDLYRPDFPLDS